MDGTNGKPTGFSDHVGGGAKQLTGLSVSKLLGLPGLPTTAFGVRKWLSNNAIPCTLDGKRFTFSLLDLPEPVQLAYRLKLAEEAGLAFGEQDDAAHIALASKPVGVQHTAHARAKVLGLVHKGRKAGLKWHQIAPQIKAAGLGEVPSEAAVKRWFKRVEGIDPANWARYFCSRRLHTMADL